MVHLLDCSTQLKEFSLAYWLLYQTICSYYSTYSHKVILQNLVRQVPDEGIIWKWWNLADKRKKFARLLPSLVWAIMHSKHTPFTSCENQLLLKLWYTLKKITTKHVKRSNSTKVVYFLCSPQMSASTQLEQFHLSH